MQQTHINDLRAQIDALNSQLITVLNQRAQVAQAIGRAKQDTAIYRPGREAAVLAAVVQANQGPLPDAALQAIFREIIGACRNLEQQLRVAYLGPEGTYTEEAARLRAGSTSAFISAATIKDTMRLVEAGEADIAIVPIENSSEGPVSQTLDALLKTPLHICGEIQLPIHHQLLTTAASGAKVAEVFAHPQALAQCQAWLAQHLPHATQTACSSNAEGAKKAAARPDAAAIAGTRASERYKLPVLAKNIEDESTNTTRFIVVGSSLMPPTGNDKTSLICTVPNKTGALHELLGLLAAEQVNLTSLQSRPVKHTAWEYSFYIDIDGHQDDAAVQRALQAVVSRVSQVKILGSYPRAEV